MSLNGVAVKLWEIKFIPKILRTKQLLEYVKGLDLFPEVMIFLILT